jgi:hypothetical protein
MRAEKRKWDGRLSSVGPARIVDAPADAIAWYVAAGSERTLPSKHSTEVLARHELWVAVPGEWWVLCGEGSATGDIESYVLHAAAPFESPSADLISWIDLDLDFEVAGDDVGVEDEAQFHAHARTMPYPDEVVRGAWSGISSVAPRYTTGEWPFDGWLGGALANAASGEVSLG